MRNHLAVKAAALASSLLLAGWYLHFRATGNSWLYTRAAEGASDGLSAASAPSTAPKVILPSSKSGALFAAPGTPGPANTVGGSSFTVQLAPPPNGPAILPGTPASQSPADMVRLRNEKLIPMTTQDVRMSSSKSIVVFDSRDAGGQAGKVKSVPSPAPVAATPPDRSMLLSGSKSGAVFTPSPKAPTPQPPASAPAPAPAPAPRKGGSK